MNLLTFMWRTAPMLYVANGILVCGLGMAIHSGEPANIAIASTFLILVVIASIIGTMNHRSRLVTDRLGRYISNLCVWSRQGNPLPDQKMAADYVDHCKRNPLG